MDIFWNHTIEKRRIRRKRMSVAFSCGFSRVAVKESFHKPSSVAKESDPVQRWQNYLELLDESARAQLAVDRTLYVKKVQNHLLFVSENELSEQA